MGKIHEAARQGDIPALQRLLKGVPIDAKNANEGGSTPLADAAQSANLATVKWLLARGAQATYVNNRGLSILDFATCYRVVSNDEGQAIVNAVINGGCDF